MPDDEVKSVLLRMPTQQHDDVAARAKKVGMSRNAWMLRALAWALDQPIKSETVTIRRQV